MNQVLEKICIVCRREFPKDVQECPDDLVRLTEKDPLLGTVFDGKFEMIDFIGVGGLSRVYKGRHVELNRIYAIKILKSSEFIDLQRFRREAISIGQLEHPNIGRVFSFSVAANGRPYMVLEYIEGKDLSDLIAKDGALSSGRCIEIFAQVCAAIAYAHSKGIVHRDIKPGNVLILSHPQDDTLVKVVDFGMARLMNETQDAQKITRTGEIFGTRQYISPEQYSGAPADERADVYALGVSLKESLGNARAPEPLKKIIERATQHDPAKRYQSADEMRAVLMELVEKNDQESKEGKSGYTSGIQLWALILGLLLIAAAGVTYIKSTVDSKKNSPEQTIRSISSTVPIRYAATESIANDLIAKGMYAQASDIMEKWFEKNNSTASSSDLAYATINLSNCLAVQKRFQEALQICNKSIKIIATRTADKPTGKDLYNLAAVYTQRGKTYLLAKRPKVARSSFETAIDLVKSVNNEAAMASMSGSYANIGTAFQDEGNFVEAEKWARKAHDLSVKIFGTSSRVTANADENLASALIAQGKFREALDIANNAVKIRKETTPTREAIYTLQASCFRTQCEIALGETETARIHFKELTTALNKTSPGINKPVLEKMLPRLNQIADALKIPAEERSWNKTNSQAQPF